MMIERSGPIKDPKERHVTKRKNFVFQKHVVSDQAVHSFQLKLLSSEISPKNDTHDLCHQKRAASRKNLFRNLDNHLMPSIIFVLGNRVRNHVVSSERRLLGKLVKFSEKARQAEQII